MTRTILAFADRYRAVDPGRAPLRCVWIATGNPNQPLVRKWAASENRSSEQGDAVSGQWCALCA